MAGPRARVGGHARRGAAAIWEAFCAPEPSALAELVGARAFRVCRSWRRRSGACSKSCRRRATASPRRSGVRSRRWRRAHARHRPRSSPRSEWRKRRFSAMPGSIARSSTWGAGWLSRRVDGTPLPAAPPLTDGQVFARLPIRLTDEGERVLGGELDRVELLGVDRWLGGTHVTADNLWRWDGAAGVLIPPAAASRVGRRRGSATPATAGSGRRRRRCPASPRRGRVVAARGLVDAVEAPRARPSGTAATRRPG